MRTPTLSPVQSLFGGALAFDDQLACPQAGELVDDAAHVLDVRAECEEELWKHLPEVTITGTASTRLMASY